VQEKHVQSRRVVDRARKLSSTGRTFSCSIFELRVLPATRRSRWTNVRETTAGAQLLMATTAARATTVKIYLLTYAKVLLVQPPQRVGCIVLLCNLRSA
jgi:hypothetical protein